MIEKTSHMNALLDFYIDLLTDKQQEIMKLYYYEDFSLAEIGEEFAISRSAVSDHIKRSSKILEEYEKKLHLVKKYETRTKIYDKIKEIENDQLKEWIEELEKIDND